MFALARGTRLDPFAELDRLFDGVLAGAPANGSVDFVPAMEITEDDEAYVVRTELPGVAPAEVQVTIEDGVLTVRGEKKADAPANEGCVHRTERRYGRFQRSVRFPVAVDSSAVSAAHANGVLSVRLPKDAKSRARTIQVNVAE